MGLFAHIVLLGLGLFIVLTIYQLELKRFRMGNTGRYVKLRKAICNEPDFIAKLKASIFHSFIVRFALIGILAFATYAYAQSIGAGKNLLGLSKLEYLIFWISSSMIAMVDRGHTAITYGHY